MSPPSASQVLATVGGRAVTQADFDAEAARRAASGRPAESAQALLSNLVERAALLVRAEAAGIATNAAFVHDTENRMISQYIAGTLAKQRDGASVSEDELQAAYAARKESVLSAAALTRLAVLYRKGAGDAAAELTKTLAAAVAAFENDRAAATNNGRLPGFGRVAADNSEDTVSRYRGGDLGWLDLSNGSHPRVPAEVLAAGVLLATNQISAPIRAGDGVWVVMKDGERAAKQVSYQEAVPMLKRRLLREKQSAVEGSFKRDLLASVPVKINEAKTAKLELPETLKPQIPQNP